MCNQASLPFSECFDQQRANSQHDEGIAKNLYQKTSDWCWLCCNEHGFDIPYQDSD